jgi:tetratricopeptide (TPR) repeat protein
MGSIPPPETEGYPVRAMRLAYVCVIVLFGSLAFAGPFEEGIAALDRKDYDRAIACFDACLHQDPNDVSALGNRGLAHAEKKDYDRAIADCSSAIYLNQRIAILYVIRANACCGKKEYDRAIADYTSAIALDTKLAAALRGRADAHADKMEYDKAITDYTAALQLDPNDPVLLSNRGTAFTNRRVYNKAIADFMKALKIDPNSAPASNNFAWLLATCPNEQLRDGKMAVDYASRACELTGWKSAGPLTSLAAAHAECGNFPEAIRCENRAISLGLGSKYEIDRSRMRLKLYEAGEAYHNQ